jgi:hypothetical protein
MRVIIIIAICLTSSFVWAQSVPPKTLIHLIATQDFNKKTFKSKETTGIIVVEKDVVVNGKTVISAQTPVLVRLDKATASDLKVIVAEVKTTDGSTVVIDDCWLYTSIDENLTGKPKGPVFRKNTRKICYTR